MTDLDSAIRILKERDDLTLALCKGENILTDTRKGIAPMMELLARGAELDGFSAADRVVGKAAAFLFLLAGVREVFAGVVSEAALNVLSAHGIPCRYEIKTAYIVNRQGDGPCPMESAVRDVHDPAQAYAVLQKTLAALRAKGN